MTFVCCSGQQESTCTYENKNNRLMNALVYTRIKFLAFFHWVRLPVSLRELENDLNLAEMDSSNSSKSRRVHDCLPSIQPSFLSVMLLFAWVKNETTNERLTVLENRVNMFPLEIIVKTGNSLEHHKITTLMPKEESARHPLNKLKTTTADNESKFDRP